MNTLGVHNYTFDTKTTTFQYRKKNKVAHFSKYAVPREATISTIWIFKAQKATHAVHATIGCPNENLTHLYLRYRENP